MKDTKYQLQEDDENGAIHICSSNPIGDGEFTMCGKNLVDCGNDWDDNSGMCSWIVINENPKGKINCPTCISNIKEIKKIRL
jgi:hypothetical protein